MGHLGVGLGGSLLRPNNLSPGVSTMLPSHLQISPRTAANSALHQTLPHQVDLTGGQPLDGMVDKLSEAVLKRIMEKFEKK